MKRRVYFSYYVDNRMSGKSILDTSRKGNEDGQKYLEKLEAIIKITNMDLKIVLKIFLKKWMINFRIFHWYNYGEMVVEMH